MATHSVMVAELVLISQPTQLHAYELARAALMHDASEAYMSDIPRPLKQSLRVHGPGGVVHIGQTEQHLLRVIFEAMDIPWPDNAGWNTIHHADDMVLRAEAESLMPPNDWTRKLPKPPSFLRITPQQPGDARSSFLRLNAQLIVGARERAA